METPTASGQTRRWRSLLLPESVRSRLTLGFGLLVATLVIVVAAGAWFVRMHESDLAAAQQSALIASELQDAQRYGATELVALNQYLETGDASMLPYVISYHGSTQRASANAQSYLEEQGNTSDIAKLNDFNERYRDTFQPIAVMYQLGRLDEADAALTQAWPQIEQLGTEYETLIDSQRQRVAGLRADAKATARWALWLLVVSGVIGTALGMAVSVLIGRSILRPLADLERTARSIGAGRLDARTAPSGPRELAHLALTLNSTMDDLEEREQDLRLSNEELKERNRQLVEARTMAATDALTGLPNHRSFHEAIRREVNAIELRGGCIGVIMLDIDGFKLVNDTLGHLEGDDILRGCADAFCKVVDRACIYRYGGDEFAVLVPGASEVDTAEVAEKLRAAVAGRRDMGIRNVTVSLGVASYPEDARSAEELIYGADAAMYRAKAAGKNRVGRRNGVGGPEDGVGSAHPASHHN